MALWRQTILAADASARRMAIDEAGQGGEGRAATLLPGLRERERDRLVRISRPLLVQSFSGMQTGTLATLTFLLHAHSLANNARRRSESFCSAP